MGKSQFDAMLEETFAEFGDDYITVPADVQKPHVFSKRFERKMQKLMRHKWSLYFSSVRLPVEKASAVLVLALLSLMMQAMGDPSVHNQYPGFITAMHTNYVYVIAESDEDAPETIETFYDLTGIPEGFAATENILTEYRHMEFINPEKHIDIRFSQRAKSQLSVRVNGEKSPMRRALVNGHNGYFIEEPSGNYLLMWDDDDYIFYIDIVFDGRYYTWEQERELIKPYLENMKIVERDTSPMAQHTGHSSSDFVQEILHDGIEVVEIVE